MQKQITEDRAETVFEDFKKPYDMKAAVAEANRCLYCEDAPCITACPTSINIPEFIRRIATENIQGSAETIFDSNIFGMSCARVCPVETLCVGDCVFNHMEQPPIQIGKLQRYATDQAFEQDWSFFEPGADTGKRVAIVGGGPASIACAHELRLLGHSPTIFESRDVLGGLNTWGVAPYKMKADRALEEVNWIMQIGGIEVKTGVTVGQDVSFDELKNDYDAVFLGFGLGLDKFLKLEDEGLDGIYGAVEFIEKIKLEQPDVSNVQTAVVLGGGNTAIDAVRQLKGLGIPSVKMVYRGTEERMSGYAHEWEAAKIEGIEGVWHMSPNRFFGENTVTGVLCDVLDQDKKPTGAQQNIEADLVLLAVGQDKQGDIVQSLPGLEIEWGVIKVDSMGRTGCDGVFAGGDCANGAKEVVNATAEGRDAARAIDQYLN